MMKPQSDSMDTISLSCKTASYMLLCLCLYVFAPSNVCSQTTVSLKKGRRLLSVLTQEQRDTCTMLAVEGRLNSADIRVLRQMAGFDENGRSGKLRVLDLRKALFVKDEQPFMILDAAGNKLSGTALPDRCIENSSSAASELQNAIDKTIFLYRPKFILGYTRKEPVTEETITEGYSQSMPLALQKTSKESEGDFRFACGITDKLWKKMNEDYRVTSFKGHRITNEMGRYMLFAYPRRHTFMADMFYGCPNLKVLLLSRKTKIDCSVMDDTAHFRIERAGKH